MRALILLLACMGAALADPQRKLRIVGGTPTTISQYPFMSNMQFNFLGIMWFQACGGTLITTRSILSASHCYYEDPASSWRVRLGTSFASSDGSVHQVSQIILHNRYNNINFNNDVAIIRLSSVVTLTATVQVAQIAGPNYNLPDGSVVTSVGWGTLSPGGVAPEQLQHVDINVINQAICAARYAYLKTLPGYENWPDITDGMLCAGILDIGGKDACQGDSGGPLLYSRNTVVGVTSWGFSCAHEFYPGVNARVSYYSDWITTNGSPSKNVVHYFLLFIFAFLCYRA